MFSYNLTRPNLNAPSYSFETFESSSTSFTFTNPSGQQTLVSHSYQRGQTYLENGWTTQYNVTEFSTSYLSHDAATCTFSYTAGNGQTLTPASINQTDGAFGIYVTQVAEGDGNETVTVGGGGGTGYAAASLTVEYVTSTVSTWESTVSTTTFAEISTTTIETGLEGGVPSYTIMSNGLTTALTTTETTAVFSQEVGSGSFVITNTPVELGTVYRTNERNEWMWAPVASPDLGDYNNVNTSFITDCGNAVTETEYWPNVLNSVLVYVDGGGTGTSYHGADAWGATYTDTVISGVVGEKVATVTDGGFFSRDTLETAVPNETTTLSTSYFGFDSHTIQAYGTYNTTYVYFSVFTRIVPQLALAEDGLNFSTYQSFLTWPQYSTFTENRGYNNTFSQNSGAHGVYSENKAGTITYAIGARLMDLANEDDLAFGSVFKAEFLNYPVKGGLRAPNAIHQADAVGTNLDASPRIYYPFVSSIQESVETPLIKKGKFMAVDSANVTWRYSWHETNQNLLSFTSQTNATATPVSGTASFNVDGATAGFYTAGTNHTVFGGFGVFTESQESVYRTPAGWKRTTVFADGAISTNTFLNTSFETFAVPTGQVVIETFLPTYIPRPEYGAFNDIITYTRNGTY